jgi:hypothetical protein
MNKESGQTKRKRAGAAVDEGPRLTGSGDGALSGPVQGGINSLTLYVKAQPGPFSALKKVMI